MISLMIAMVMNNSVTKEKQEYIQRRPFDPMELLTIKHMDREGLLALMVFCEIRVLNEVPVAALTDDELRMAYVLWRGEGQKVRKQRNRGFKKTIRTIKKSIIQQIERSVLP